MTVGTKSLLFGVHQFIWHPITVLMAWVWLYRGLPTFGEFVGIVIHDWGYWGCPNMDGAKGIRHPEWAAWSIRKRFKSEYLEQFCLFHSRHYAKLYDREPSQLCWADKCSVVFDPWWLYLPRAMASGEIAEYRKSAAAIGTVPLAAGHLEWYRWMRGIMLQIGRERNMYAAPFINFFWQRVCHGKEIENATERKIHGSV